MCTYKYIFMNIILDKRKCVRDIDVEACKRHRIPKRAGEGN